MLLIGRSPRYAAAGTAGTGKEPLSVQEINSSSQMSQTENV